MWSSEQLRQRSGEHDAVPRPAGHLGGRGGHTEARNHKMTQGRDDTHERARVRAALIPLLSLVGLRVGQAGGQRDELGLRDVSGRPTPAQRFMCESKHALCLQHRDLLAQGSCSLHSNAEAEGEHGRRGLP